MRLRVSAVAFAAFGLASSGTFAAAATAGAPHVLMQRAIVPATAPGVQHRFFGTLQGVNGQLLVLLLRDGRLLHVDATQAFALKHVSQPLFRSKSTVVDGTFAANGVFYATVVKRGAISRLNWGVDR